MRYVFAQIFVVMVLTMLAQPDRARVEVAAAADPDALARGESALTGSAVSSSGRDTRIRYVVSRSTHVSLAIYDMSGRRVRHLSSREARAGSYIVAWDGRNDLGRPVQAGIYYYHLSVADGGGRNSLIVIGG